MRYGRYFLQFNRAPTKLTQSSLTKQAEYSIDLVSVGPAFELGEDSVRTSSPESIAITTFLRLFIESRYTKF